MWLNSIQKYRNNSLQWEADRMQDWHGWQSSNAALLRDSVRLFPPQSRVHNCGIHFMRALSLRVTLRIFFGFAYYGYQTNQEWQIWRSTAVSVSVAIFYYGFSLLLVCTSTPEYIHQTSVWPLLSLFLVQNNHNPSGQCILICPSSLVPLGQRLQTVESTSNHVVSPCSTARAVASVWLKRHCIT